MSDKQTPKMESPSLELKPLGRETKSLKHKHKSKRAQQLRGEGGAPASSKGGELKRSPSAASPGRHHAHNKRSTKSNRDDALRELLAGKIAEIEVGGDENLEAPIDLSGIYQDDTLSAQLVEKAEAVKGNGEMQADEKVATLVNCVNQASEQLGLMQKKIGELNAKCILLKQRKSAVSTELVKTNTSKSKLEQLCRELQKQNKLIVSESRRIADEEDQKRRELSAQFQKTIEEVSAKMDQQGKDYVASLKENENLQQKLKSFFEQYTAREEHFQRQLEAKDLTVQLAETKLQHQVELTSREAEKVKITLDKAKEFSDREVQLQSQLNSYSEKFDVVQETLTKSNEMFTTFRAEMDKMAKTTKKLEKENLALRKKCAQYDSGAIASIQEKVTTAEETQKLQEKVKKLESLCRHLQAERNSFRQAQQVQTAAAAATESNDDSEEIKPMKSAPSSGGYAATSSISAPNTAATTFTHAKKRIGGKDAPVNYSFEEHVFCPGDTAPDKAAAKLEVVEMLRSRILSSETPQWDMSTSNWDNMQMTGKCYKRTNVNAERNRAHMFAYNLRAEKLPKKNPTLKSKSNRFNTGILEVELKDVYMGEAFGDERVMKGIAKCTEELPNHPNLRDAKPWNQSVELTKTVRKQHFAALEAARQTNSDKWRHKVSAKDNYKTPEQLSKELSERKRQEKQELVAVKSNQ